MSGLESFWHSYWWVFFLILMVLCCFGTRGRRGWGEWRQEGCRTRKGRPKDHKEEQVMEWMKKRMENMSGEERVEMMERCFTFMKRKETGQDKEHDEEKREESARFPDMGKISECCPTMGTFFSKMKSCCEDKGEDSMNDPREKTEEHGCRTR